MTSHGAHKLFDQLTRVYFADVSPSLDAPTEQSDLRSPHRIPSKFHDDLLSVITGLSAWHQAYERGHGDIGEDSLKLDAAGRLHLFLKQVNPGEKSRCQMAHRNETNARFYVHVGQMPRPVDDWVALGVAAAELIVPADQRPAIEPDVNLYAERVAGHLRPSWWKRDQSSRTCRLVARLCCADRDRFDGVTEVSRQGSLLALESDGAIRGASVGERWRSAGLNWLLIATPFLFFAAAWIGMLIGKQGDRVSVGSKSLSSVQDQIETLRRDNERLRQEAEEARLNLQGISTSEVKPGESNSSKDALLPKVEVNELKSLALFQQVSQVPGFVDDSIAPFLAQDTIEQSEASVITKRMKDFVLATRLWWSWIDARASQKQIEWELENQDLSIRKIVNSWLVQTTKPQKYRIVVSSLKRPEKDSASYDVVINGKVMKYDPQQMAKTDSPSASDQELKKEKPASPAGVNLVWSFGEPIRIKLERRWSYFLYDRDLFEVELDEALPMYSLATKRFLDKEKRYSLRLRVIGLQGPARPGSAAQNGVGTNQPGQGSAAETQSDKKAGKEKDGGQDAIPLDLELLQDLVP